MGSRRSEEVHGKKRPFMEKITMKTTIKFVDDEVKDSFKKLSEGKNEEKQLLKHITSAFEKLEKNYEKGSKIPRKIWPKEYVEKYNIDNLWKINLSNAWRLIYTIKADNITILAIILEWLKHKEYEKKFNYTKK